MSYYRLYFRDREGHFSGCRQFQAPSDAQAIGRADRMTHLCCREPPEGSGNRRSSATTGDRQNDSAQPAAC